MTKNIRSLKDLWFLDEPFDLDKLKDAISTLPPRIQTVVTQRYDENKIYSDIGKTLPNLTTHKMGVSAERVRYLVAKGARMLHGRRAKILRGVATSRTYDAN